MTNSELREKALDVISIVFDQIKDNINSGLCSWVEFNRCRSYVTAYNLIGLLSDDEYNSMCEEIDSLYNSAFFRKQ